MSFCQLLEILRAASIASSYTIKGLELSNNNIGNVGANALAQNTRLKYLSISNNHIGASGREALIAANIERLDMDNNEDALKATYNAHCTFSHSPVCVKG